MSARRNTLELVAVPHMPRVQPGDDLGDLLVAALLRADLAPRTDDVFVVAQKIVSKAEGRYVDLAQVVPRRRAIELAEASDKDPRLVEVILGESDQVLRCRAGLLIVRHRLGFVMANAGVDQSNLERNDDAGRVLLLPADPDASCARLKRKLDDHFGVEVGVVISDSVGRAWRIGTVGLALGLAGVPAVQDLRGTRDLYNRALQTSEVGFADLVASAAMLLMGEGAEGTPVVLVRGLAYTNADATASLLVRPLEQDLFQ